MSLFDVDMVSQDRSAPMPNTHDKVIDRLNYGTISTHYTTAADTTPGFLKMQNKGILANDGTTARGIYGWNQALGQWGFFLTKPGIDATTNTDLSQFYFNSNQDVFRIVQTGNAFVTIPNPNVAGTQYFSSVIAHNLNYVPGVIAFVTPPSGFGGGGFNAELPWISTAPLTVSGTPIIYVYFILDIHDLTATTIQFYGRLAPIDATYSGQWGIKYYLLQQTAE